MEVPFYFSPALFQGIKTGWRVPTSAADASPVVIPGAVLSPFVPTSTAINATESATAEAASPRLKIFPNPSSDKVFVHSTTTEKDSVNRYNHWGGLVQPLFEGISEAGAENEVEVDGQPFASDLYVVRVVTPQKVEVQKIILMK